MTGMPKEVRRADLTWFQSAINFEMFQGPGVRAAAKQHPELPSPLT